MLYIAASAVGYLSIIYIPGALIVTGNAAATASNIAAHESLFRWGIGSYLFGGILFLFVTIALYQLLEQVDRGLAVLMVILGGVISTTIFVVNTMTFAGALMFVRGADSLSVIDKPQREAFATVFLDLHHYLDLANSTLWGIWLIPFGLLVYKSRFLPRLLGVWLMIGCFAYLAFSVSGFLFPGAEEKVFAFGAPFRMGELATMLWLAVMGAKEQPLEIARA